MSFGGDDEYGHARSGRQGTRTRLPETESGAARSAPLRPGRNVLMVVGVVMLLIGAIAVATRAGEDDGRGGNSREQAQPTAPTGVKPVGSGADGIPAGFARTEQGAQSAAANYVVLLGGDGMYDDGRRARIIDAVYSPKVAAKRRDDINKVYGDSGFLGRIGLKEDGSAPRGMTFVSRVSPVGTNTLAFDDRTAKVEVWYSALFGLAGKDSENPVTEAWYTNTFDLEWVGGDWKIVDFEQVDGPAPVGRDQRASSAEEMADAVERFGGFTYAR
ncbi:hypothetical protein H3146_20150 [Streptomyces sp. OF3]|uniref:Uncharacterized protein n=1 Tax=Streptomyces alkaliterrae TaxID=2213162 RepID=A0A7W3WP02_9ACTN|nr:hypothetical protein [Streptomyces alkaliterrae]MBB1255650.1 hypothetical protein [Streptomyces alkaliterrae]